MQVLVALMAALAGAALSFQAGASARMGQHTPTMFHAALLNFVVGSAVLAPLALLSSPRSGLGIGRAMEAPWWTWLGGVCGATFVAMTVKATPALGAVLMLACVIAGQMAGSIAIDHFGMLGLASRPATPARLAGLALVFLGAWLILRDR